MTNPLLKGVRPIHPGELLREDVLPAFGRPKTEIARLMGISRQTLHELLAEKQPVTVPMALRIAKLIGDTPEVWLNMQRAYDLKLAESAMAEEIARIPTLREAA